MRDKTRQDPLQFSIRIQLELTKLYSGGQEDKRNFQTQFAFAVLYISQLQEDAGDIYTLIEHLSLITSVYALAYMRRNRGIVKIFRQELVKGIENAIVKGSAISPDPSWHMLTIAKLQDKRLTKLKLAIIALRLIDYQLEKIITQHCQIKQQLEDLFELLKAMNLTLKPATLVLDLTNPLTGKIL